MTETQNSLVGQALLYLSERCDGALARDGQGFNGTDSSFGKSLAGQIAAGRNLSPKQMQAALKMLRKYQGQLAGGGIDFDLLEQQAKRQPTAQVVQLAPRRIDHDGARGLFIVSWDYRDERHFDLKQALKDIQGRRWNSDTKVWTLPTTSTTAQALKTFAKAYAFKGSRAAHSAIEALLTEAPAKVTKVASGNAVLPALALDLYPFQQESARFALDKGSALIADEMGLGKTPEAIAYIMGLGKRALVVCTAKGKSTWPRDFAKFAPSLKWHLLNGTKVKANAIPAGTQVVLVNYDVLVKWAKVIQKWAPEAAVFDESQRLKEPSTGWTKAAHEIVKGGHYDKTKKQFVVTGKKVENVLLLSGTPAKNRPVEYASQLDLLGALHTRFGGWKAFVTRYCDAHQIHIGQGRYALDTQGSSNLQELHQKLTSTVMIRHTKAQVLPDLPKVQNTTISVSLSNADEYEFAVEEFLAWLEANEEDTTGAMRAEKLVKLGKLRGLTAQGKVEGTLEWIEEFMEGSNEKLLVFAHHSTKPDIQAQLFKALKDKYNAIAITGGMATPKVTAAVDKFQDDPTCRVAVLSLMGVNEGVTLTGATNVMFVEFDWSPGTHDQGVARCYGRMNDVHGANAYYMAAAGTTDEKLVDMLNRKRAVIEMIADGKTDRASKIDFNVMDSFIDSLKANRK